MIKYVARDNTTNQLLASWSYLLLSGPPTGIEISPREHLTMLDQTGRSLRYDSFNMALIDSTKFLYMSNLRWSADIWWSDLERESQQV